MASYNAGTPGTVPDGLEPVQQHDYPEVLSGPTPKDNYTPSPAPAYAFAPSSSPEKTIFGLRRTTFILVVLRGVADGAEGTAPVTTGSPTATPGRVPPPPEEGILELDCPNINDKTRRVSVGDTTSIFRRICGVNYPFNDITRLPAYSFLDCMRACVVFNIMDGVVKNITCGGVYFDTHIDSIVNNGGNCWLKTKLENSVVEADDAKINLAASAEREA
ncbi:uncharacterized protein DNG_03970 [Cephalotrichum gorgonifer]|uniref:Apple domain-containing protein n=1 Tax=Cephalotrichum gorgonifer TaxID=2041049 RepID=A0AAE8MXJ9_9PEZI|nr:uncharacterized protein DNG_03970 [Cephalotrichum gorgonifer]